MDQIANAVYRWGV